VICPNTLDKKAIAFTNMTTNKRSLGIDADKI
jgi:hypothetical protein